MKTVLAGPILASVALVMAWSATTQSAEAGPYNQSMDRYTQEKIDGFVWLYGEAAKGNETARGNLAFLTDYYGSELSEKAMSAAIESWGVEVADITK